MKVCNVAEIPYKMSLRQQMIKVPDRQGLLPWHMGILPF